MTQAITQAVTEPAKAAIMVVRETDAPSKEMSTTNSTKSKWPALRQPTFDWKVQDKYNE